MVNRAFQYDLNSSDWVECVEENFINADIEKTPSVLVLNYSELPNHVYCPKHHYLEKIVEENDSELISYNGCKFKDSDRIIDKKLLYCPIHGQLEEIILTDGNEIITDAFCKFNSLVGFGVYECEEIPFRWRIFQRSPESPINIAVDFAKVHRDNSGIKKYWRTYSISISITKRISVMTKIKDYWGHFENWTEKSEIKMPKIVEDAAMETLRESTKAVYGFKPTIITKFKGIKKIFAYLERPFDVNIILLKSFFAHFGKFDDVFPYDCTDNYKIICRLLEINPPKSLRKAYAKNPYAIIWYIIFKQFGVKDINFMQKFFLLEYITVMPLNDFCFYRKDNKVVKMHYSDRWLAFENFCKSLIDRKGEKFMMNWLYKFSTTENLTQNQIDTFEMLYKYKEHISAELKDKVFKDGLTWYIHDAISAEVTDYLQERDNVKIFYDEKVLTCEGVINDYKFEVVKETKRLYHVGLELANCVMTYRDKVLYLDSIIFVASKENKLVACIEICDGEIVQALGYHNQDLTGEVAQAVQEWRNLKDITALKDATAEISQNEVKKKISTLTHFEDFGCGDMISQEEIDALLAGGVY